MYLWVDTQAIIVICIVIGILGMMQIPWVRKSITTDEPKRDS